MPPLCRETQSLGQQMLMEPLGINGLRKAVRETIVSGQHEGSISLISESPQQNSPLNFINNLGYPKAHAIYLSWNKCSFTENHLALNHALKTKKTFLGFVCRFSCPQQKKQILFPFKNLQEEGLVIYLWPTSWLGIK